MVKLRGLSDDGFIGARSNGAGSVARHQKNSSIKKVTKIAWAVCSSIENEKKRKSLSLWKHQHQRKR
jgi:hypothetical protein